MPTKNNIRRNYLIIKRILRNDLPSAEIIMKHLENYDVCITPRTFQRDLANIRSNFDIDVIYEPTKNGYYVNEEGSSDLSKLLYFMELVESSDVALQSLLDRKETLRHLSISPTVKPKGIDLIFPLLQAIKNSIEIRFNHYNYAKQTTKYYTAEPYLLKEFSGRWYLFAFLREKGIFRTFGLDRIENLVFSDSKFVREKDLEITASKFEDIYGLVYEPDQNKNAKIETVRLRLSSTMISHLEAAPLHKSQKADKNNGTITLNVIINPELENKILSYGEHATVISPNSLKERIKQRLKKTLEGY